MNDFYILLLAFVEGQALGWVFFGGLWWTIRKSVASSRPWLWFFASAVLRMSIALPGLYWIGRGHWERLLVGLLGFVMARLIVTWLTRTSAGSRIHQVEEADCALKP